MNHIVMRQLTKLKPWLEAYDKVCKLYPESRLAVTGSIAFYLYGLKWPLECKDLDLILISSTDKDILKMMDQDQAADNLGIVGSWECRESISNFKVELADGQEVLVDIFETNCDPDKFYFEMKGFTQEPLYVISPIGILEAKRSMGRDKDCAQLKEVANSVINGFGLEI